MNARCRLPVGAEVADGGVDFRVWAPQSKSVRVVRDDLEEMALAEEADGDWSGFLKEGRAEMQNDATAQSALEGLVSKEEASAIRALKKNTISAKLQAEADQLNKSTK